MSEHLSAMHAATQPRSVSAEEFRRAARCFASGVTIVSADDGQAMHAITATAFCSLSLDPPLVLVAVGEASRLLPLARAAGHYGVSVLGEGHRDAAVRSAVPGRALGDDTVATRRGLCGVPLVEGAVATFECALESEMRQGDHVILIGRVVRCSAQPSREQPLLYYQGGYHALETPPEQLAAS